MPHDAFDIEALVDCYRRGVFPMADAREDERVFLIDPQKRGVIPLDDFHISKRLARTVRSGRFEVTVDTAFSTVVETCAEATDGRPDTWINWPIQHLYEALHRTRRAHSVECRLDGRLVGGLYGVALGGAFFGESMFSRERDAQFMTEHLAQFGAREVTRVAYRCLLEDALTAETDFYRFADDGPEALQAISQAS